MDTSNTYTDTMHSGADKATTLPRMPKKDERLTAADLVALALNTRHCTLLQDAAILEAGGSQSTGGMLLTDDGRLLGLYGRQPEAAQAWLAQAVIARYGFIVDGGTLSTAIRTLNAMTEAAPVVSMRLGSLAVAKDGRRIYRTTEGFITVDGEGAITMPTAAQPDPATTGVFFAPQIARPGARCAYPALDASASYEDARAWFRYLAIEEREAQSEVLAALTTFRLWNPRTPCYANAISGLAGGGKSTLAEALAQPIEPRMAADSMGEAMTHATRYNLGDERSFALAVEDSDALVIDNVDLEMRMASDLLASAITGGSARVEVKYSNAAKSISLCRPTIINGLMVGGKSDLLTRYFPTQVADGEKPVPPDMQPGESFAQWQERLFPRAFSGMMRLMCAVVKRLADTENPIPAESGRFSAVHRWLTAVDELTGWRTRDTLRSTTEGYRTEQSAESLIVQALTAKSTMLSDWEGTPAELVELIGQEDWKSLGGSKTLTARGVGRQLTLEAENLRLAGWEIRKTRPKGVAHWHISAPESLTKAPADTSGLDAFTAMGI